jgi:hypothetical protein
MPLHYMLAKRQREKAAQTARVARKAATTAAFGVNTAELYEEMDDEEVGFYPDFSDDDEEVEDGEGMHLYQGVDLTQAPWDAGWMQALLNIDTSVKRGEGRPPSDRMEWIGLEEGYRVLFTEADELAAAMEESMRLF